MRATANDTSYLNRELSKGYPWSLWSAIFSRMSVGRLMQEDCEALVLKQYKSSKCECFNDNTSYHGSSLRPRRSMHHQQWTIKETLARTHLTAMTMQQAPQRITPAGIGHVAAHELRAPCLEVMLPSSKAPLSLQEIKSVVSSTYHVRILFSSACLNKRRAIPHYQRHWWVDIK